jgi:Phosphate-selective porin O and P
MFHTDDRVIHLRIHSGVEGIMASWSKAGCSGFWLTIVVVLLWCPVSRAQTSGAPDETDQPAEQDSAPVGSEMETPPDQKPSKRLKLNPPRVFGYMQAFYRYAFETGSDGVVDNPNFRVQRVRIGVRGDVNPVTSYDIEFDPRAPEITGVLRDAFISFKVIPHHQIRVGQQKMHFGYENIESSTRLFAVNRTEVSDNLSRGDTLRDIGVGLIGNIPLGGSFRIEDGITIGNGNGMNTQDDNTRRKSVWGRIGVRYKDRNDGALVARFGTSLGVGDLIDEGDDPVDPSDDFRLSFKRLGTDMEIDHRLFFFSTEFVAAVDENTAIHETDRPIGWYLNLVGKTPWRVGPIVRYDVLDTDFRRWTFGAYYGLPKDSLRFMINYELRQIMEDSTGNVGRGDDKLYFWTQARF